MNEVHQNQQRNPQKKHQQHQQVAVTPLNKEISTKMNFTSNTSSTTSMFSFPTTSTSYEPSFGSNNSSNRNNTDSIIANGNSVINSNKKTSFLFGTQSILSPQCNTATSKSNSVTNAVTIDTKMAKNANRTHMEANSKNDENGCTVQRNSPSMFSPFNFETGLCTTPKSSSNDDSLIDSNRNTNGPVESHHILSSSSTTSPKPAAYVTVDGRRKRRRTNLDDAFHHLSIKENPKKQHQPVYNSSSFVSPTTTAAATTTSQNYFSATNSNKATSSTQNKNESQMNPNDSFSFDVNKSFQSYDDMDGLVLHSNLDYNHETSFCSFTSTVDDVNESNVDITIGALDDDDDDDINDENNNEQHGDRLNDNDNNDESETNNINNQNQESSTSAVAALPPIHSVLFAPRKDKSKQRTMIYDHFVNPVDDRIEELIRHSRIQAMVKSSQEKQQSATHSSNSNGDIERNVQHRRDYEKMMFDSNMYNHSKSNTNSNSSRGGSGGGGGYKTSMQSFDDHDFQWKMTSSRKNKVIPCVRVDHKMMNTTSSLNRNERCRSAPRAMKYNGEESSHNKFGRENVSPSTDVEMN